MLKSITLVNWRSHKKTTINFNKGTNLLIGRMGGGKSSVIDAICFALFGNCPAIQHRKLKIIDYIRNKPDAQKEAEILLSFDFKGDSYTVRRKIKAGTTEAELRKNGELIEGPQSIRVSEYINRLFEIDYDLFTRAIYSEQNRIDYFLTLPKGERKKQIDELLGLTKFEEVRKNAVSTAGRLKEIYADKEKFIRAFNLDEIKNEIIDLENKILNLDKEYELLKKNKEEKSKQKEGIAFEFEKINKEKEKYKSLTNRKIGLSHLYENLKSELNILKFSEEEIERTKREFSEINIKKENLNRTIDVLDKEFSLISRKYGELERSETETKRGLKRRDELLSSLSLLLAGKKVEDIKKELDEWKSSLKKITADTIGYESTSRDLENAISSLKKERGKCPVCDSELTQQKREKLIEEKNKQLLELTERIQVNKKEIEIRESKIKELENKIKKIDEIQSKLGEFENLDTELMRIEDEKREIESKLTNLKEKKEEIHKEIEVFINKQSEIKRKLERIEEYINKKKKFEEITTELNFIDSQLSTLKYDEEIWEKLNKELNKYDLEIMKLNSELDAVAQNKSYLIDKVSDRRKRLDEIERYIVEAKKYLTEIEKLQTFSNALTETQQILREELITAINEALNEIWRVLYPYSDYPLVQVRPSEDDYELVFKVGEEWISVDGIASGGERALACLALRVAFAMVLTPNLSWLILDEPTHNLDEEAVRTLAEVLHDYLPKIVEQILVITHDENLKDAASGKLIRIRRSDEIPEVSVAEEII